MTDLMKRLEGARRERAGGGVDMCVYEPRVRVVAWSGVFIIEWQRECMALWAWKGLRY